MDTQDIEILDDSDWFWDKFWGAIDQSKEMVFISTYDMDHKLIAGMTMKKLINAQHRGAQVLLIIDDLNYYTSQKEVKKLKQAGGIVVRNNPIEKVWEHVFDGKY